MKKYLTSFSERSIRGGEDMFLSRISLIGRYDVLPQEANEKIKLVKEELDEYLGTSEYKLLASTDNRKDNFIIIPLNGKKQIDLRDRYITAFIR